MARHQHVVDVDPVPELRRPFSLSGKTLQALEPPERLSPALNLALFARMREQTREALERTGEASDAPATVTTVH